MKDTFLEKDPYAGLKTKPFLEKLDQALYEGQEKFKRSYVGASSIGGACLRKIQYQFRHCIEADFPSSTLKKFDDGHRSEAIYIDRIKSAEYKLQSDEDGQQFGFSDLGGWFKGHRDGYLYKLDFLDGADAIWEHKSSEKWKSLHKLVLAHEGSALFEWNKDYYYQAQLYMGYEGVKYHLLTCASAGSRDQTGVLTEFNQNDFEHAKQRAKTVIESDNLLPKISDNPDFYVCRFCDANEICHGKALPKPVCRNCAAIDFKTDGDCKAICTMFNQAFEGNPEAMESTYDCHLYMPELINTSALTDGLVEQDQKGLTYRYDGIEFTNGRFENAYKSIELYEMGLETLENKSVSDVAKAFNGKFEMKPFKKE